MSRPIVFIDTETDGLGPDRKAWEVAMIKHETVVTETESGVAYEWSETIRHFFIGLDLRGSDPKALEIGGFFDRHPVGRKLSGKTATPFEAALNAHDAAKEVMRWTYGATLVGANPAFDAEVLAQLLRRQGYLPMWHYRLVDVEALTAGHFGRLVGGLSDCCDALDLELTDAHTALGDARACQQIYNLVMPS